MTENTKNLSELSVKYPLTDKGPIKADGTPGHNYTETYEKHFSPIREKNLKILEIGFGGGDSLKLWKEYFPNAEIYCIDNNLARIEEYNYVHEEGIKIFYGDQSDASSLIESCNQMDVDQFDIIIDDGSHIASHITLTFNTLFEKYLSPGGLYFVEDYLDTLTYVSDDVKSIDYKNELTTIIKK
jgi:trans-aconitate methyltransferase